MADESLNPTPVAVTPVVTPEVIPTPAAVVPPTAPTEAVKAVVPVEAPKVEAPAVEAPKAPETLLGEGLEKTKVEPAPGEAPKEVNIEAPKEGESKETDGGQSAEPAPPPKYDPFKLPEGTTPNEERMSEFTNLLSDLELKGKADHALLQEFGQKAVDLFVDEVNKNNESLVKYYQTTWDRQKTAWKEQFLADPEIGGNRFQTTVDSALTFIRTHGGNADQQKEFKNLMESSGLGNHPAIIRLLANAGRAMSEGTPLAAPKPAPQPKSKTQTLYGKG